MEWNTGELWLNQEHTGSFGDDYYTRIKHIKVQHMKTIFA